MLWISTQIKFVSEPEKSIPGRKQKTISVGVSLFWRGSRAHPVMDQKISVIMEQKLAVNPHDPQPRRLVPNRHRGSKDPQRDRSRNPFPVGGKAVSVVCIRLAGFFISHIDCLARQKTSHRDGNNIHTHYLGMDYYEGRRDAGDAATSASPVLLSRRVRRISHFTPRAGSWTHQKKKTNPSQHYSKTTFIVALLQCYTLIWTSISRDVNQARFV